MDTWVGSVFGHYVWCFSVYKVCGHKCTFFFGIYLWVELLDHMATLFNILRNCQTFPKQLHHFTFLPEVYVGFNFCISLSCYYRHLTKDGKFDFLMASDAEHLSMYWWLYFAANHSLVFKGKERRKQMLRSLFDVTKNRTTFFSVIHVVLFLTVSS